jgi:hypothetical protein
MRLAVTHQEMRLRLEQLAAKGITVDSYQREREFLALGRV